MKSNKLKAKDFITLGIFTALFFVVVMICIFASAVTVVSYAFGPAIAAIPGGLIYMFMRVKVQKSGGIFLSGLVIGIVEFLMGAGWPVALGFIIGALIAEIISRAGAYENYMLHAVGYGFFMACFAIGTYLPMMMMTSYIDSMTSSNGVDVAFMNSLYAFINGPMVGIIAVVTFLCGMLGAFIGKLAFKKHFVRAGIA